MAPVNLPHNHGEHIAHIMENSPTPEQFVDISLLLRQLGDGSRLRLFWILCHCEECVINLSALMEMSSPAVSHHLKQLRGSNLIVSRRDGKEVYYRAADNTRARLLHQLIEQLIEHICPGQAGRDGLRGDG
jgi:DNA-binding transcriptional ArsR family regulator